MRAEMKKEYEKEWKAKKKTSVLGEANRSCEKRVKWGMIRRLADLAPFDV